MWRVEARNNRPGTFHIPGRWFGMSDWVPERVGWQLLCEYTEQEQVRYKDIQIRVFYVVE